jgi:hypothetical protein
MLHSEQSLCRTFMRAWRACKVHAHVCLCVHASSTAGMAATALAVRIVPTALISNASDKGLRIFLCLLCAHIDGGVSGALPGRMPSVPNSSPDDRANTGPTPDTLHSSCSGGKVAGGLSHPAAAGTASSCVSRAASRRSRQHSSRLAGSQRHSRSCGHLPDAHQQQQALAGSQQAGSPPSMGWVARGSPGAGGGAGSSSVLGGEAAGVLPDAFGEEGGVSVPAVELLLMQPRMPFRRRQGGRWGRRHIVVSDEQQAADR